MKANEIVFDRRSFGDQPLECPKCGWKGTGAEAHVADFYGIGKFSQVSCPECQEYLGNLSNDNSFAQGGKISDK